MNKAWVRFYYLILALALIVPGGLHLLGFNKMHSTFDAAAKAGERLVKDRANQIEKC